MYTPWCAKMQSFKNLIYPGTDKYVVYLNETQTTQFIEYHMLDLLHDNVNRDSTITYNELRLLLSAYVIWLNEVNGNKIGNIRDFIEKILIGSGDICQGLVSRIKNQPKYGTLQDTLRDYSYLILDDCGVSNCNSSKKIRTGSSMFDRGGYNLTCNKSSTVKFAREIGNDLSKKANKTPLEQALLDIYDTDAYNTLLVNDCKLNATQDLRAFDYYIMGKINNVDVVLAYRGWSIGVSNQSYNVFTFQLYRNWAYICGRANSASQSEQVYQQYINAFANKTYPAVNNNKNLVCEVYCALASKWWGDVGMALDALRYTTQGSKTYLITKDIMLTNWCQLFGIPHVIVDKDRRETITDLYSNVVVSFEENSASKF